MALFESVPVLTRGAGDLASGVIYRLARAGFPVIVTELARPLAIRRAVAFASAVFEGTVIIEGLVARRVAPAETRVALDAGVIPVLVDEAGTSLQALHPPVVVDGRMAKRKLDTRMKDAPLVIALGPGYVAGTDCHVVIETKRGHCLGRVIWQGSAEPDTGLPGGVQGRVAERVLRAPAAGRVTPQAAIGDQLQAGQVVAMVGDAPVLAPFDGVLRGLVHPSPVNPGRTTVLGGKV